VSFCILDKSNSILKTRFRGRVDATFQHHWAFWQLHDNTDSVLALEFLLPSANQPAHQNKPMNDEGTEPCPVCEKPNNPGACITCKHYLGMYSDGEVIWSDRFEGFSDAWSRLSATSSDFYDTHGRRPPRTLKTKYRKAFKAVSGFDPEDDSASQALLGLLDLEHGPTVETNGMLSSSGHSLYLAKATDLDQLIAWLETVRLEISALCTS